MLAMVPMMATTISISSSVTPRWLALHFQLSFPADYIGVQVRAAGLAVGAVADDVGLIAMIAGEFIDIGMAPRIVSEILREIGTVPLFHAVGL